MRQAPSIEVAHGRLAHVPAAGRSLSEKAQAAAAAFLSGAAFFIIILTLSPFPVVEISLQSDTTANVVNQVGFLLLGSIYLFAMIVLIDRQLLSRVITPTWIAIFAIAFASCLQSYDPAASARGVTLSLVAMILVAGILVLPRNERDFMSAGAVAVLMIIAIDYVALVVAPTLAIHGADGGEAYHAGFWRGHLLHKNVAAPVFSILCMFGIYCMRSGLVFRGGAITLLSIVFVFHTGSKTTMGFLPIAVFIVFFGRAVGRPVAAIVLHAIVTGLVFCLTLGTIYSSRFLSVTRSILEDYTFTGRDAIWRFASENLADRLWFGHGFASFWLSPVIRGLEADFEANWDVRGIVSGHNTYLDSVLTFGLPGGVLLIVLLMVKPLFDYLKAVRNTPNRRLADFFLMVIVFMTYNGMLESFYLNRADPLWLLLALAVFGLGFLARLNVRTGH